jgi:hypothetical protein
LGAEDFLLGCGPLVACETFVIAVDVSAIRSVASKIKPRGLKGPDDIA